MNCSSQQSVFDPNSTSFWSSSTIVTCDKRFFWVQMPVNFGTLNDRAQTCRVGTLSGLWNVSGLENTLLFPGIFPPKNQGGWCVVAVFSPSGRPAFQLAKQVSFGDCSWQKSVTFYVWCGIGPWCLVFSARCVRMLAEQRHESRALFHCVQETAFGNIGDNSERIVGIVKRTVALHGFSEIQLAQPVALMRSLRLHVCTFWECWYWFRYVTRKSLTLFAEAIKRLLIVVYLVCLGATSCKSALPASCCV